MKTRDRVSIFAATGQAPATGFKTTEVARFAEPWAMTFLPDGRNVLITEKAGKLILFDVATARKTAVSGTPTVSDAGQGGFGDVIVGAYAINARQDPAVSTVFPDIAYRIGNGANAVNVTLVDIRAWDTLGEITVLVVAALGIATLVLAGRRGAPSSQDGSRVLDERRQETPS